MRNCGGFMPTRRARMAEETESLKQAREPDADPARAGRRTGNGARAVSGYCRLFKTADEAAAPSLAAVTGTRPGHTGIRAGREHGAVVVPADRRRNGAGLFHPDAA